jgi:hypothetical protein
MSHGHCIRHDVTPCCKTILEMRPHRHRTDVIVPFPLSPLHELRRFAATSDSVEGLRCLCLDLVEALEEEQKRCATCRHRRDQPER